MTAPAARPPGDTDLPVVGTSEPDGGETQPATTWPICHAHRPFTIRAGDRDGNWFWACLACPATRAQGEPIWRAP